jgi:hypothetical protein
VAIAVLASALGDLVAEIEGTSQWARRKKGFRKSSLDFFSADDPDFCLWCAHLDLDPEELAEYVRTHHDDPAFKTRIREAVSLAVLFPGEDSRTSPKQLTREIDDRELGDPAEGEEKWSVSSSGSWRNGIRFATESGIDWWGTRGD